MQVELYRLSQTTFPSAAANSIEPVQLLLNIVTLESKKSDVYINQERLNQKQQNFSSLIRIIHISSLPQELSE